VKILVIDIGGNNIKVQVSGGAERIKIPSGPALTARRLIALVKEATRDWAYDAVSIGFPGQVRNGRAAVEPVNLGKGWVGADFERAFGRPVKVINDAAMQALGSYRGGRMLFLGLGTGLGGCLIIDGAIAPLEIGHLPYEKGRTFEQTVGERGRRRLGTRKWRRKVEDVVARLKEALQADYVVIGGGNVKRLDTLPAGAVRGENANAFLGGVLLWKKPSSRTRTAG
jgi:polyphosphate glucokinase